MVTDLLVGDFSFVAWHKVCRSKTEWGLGLRTFDLSILPSLGNESALWEGGGVSLGLNVFTPLWWKVIMGKWYRGRVVGRVNCHLWRVSPLWSWILEVESVVE